MTLSELSLFQEANGFANQAEVQENPDLIGVHILRDASKGELSFLTNSQSRGPLRDTRASTAIVDLAQPTPGRLVGVGLPEYLWRCRGGDHTHSWDASTFRLGSRSPGHFGDVPRSLSASRG